MDDEQAIFTFVLSHLMCRESIQCLSSNRTRFEPSTAIFSSVSFYKSFNFTKKIGITVPSSQVFSRRKKKKEVKHLSQYLVHNKCLVNVGSYCVLCKQQLLFCFSIFLLLEREADRSLCSCVTQASISEASCAKNGF